MNDPLKPPVISWQQLPGNKFNRSIHPAMLCPTGYTKYMNFDKGAKGLRGYVEVCYDKNYVIEWLVTKFVEPLGSFEFNQLEAMLKDAHVRFTEQKKAELQRLDNSLMSVNSREVG